MRVLLVNPRTDSFMGVWQPLGLGYLAGELTRAGHEVAYFDRLACPDRDQVDEQMLGYCRQARPELIGLSATTPLIPDAYHVASLLKTEFPQATIVIGGPHATALPEQTLAECPALDLVAVGEGELTIATLAEGTSPDAVPGVAYRVTDGMKLTGTCRRAQDLDDLAPPRRDLLAPEYYFQTHDQLVRGLRLRGAHIVTGRGCTHRCRFCVGSLCSGPGLRFHSTERVVFEIEALVTDYDIEGIYIADDVFLAKPERTIELCHAVMHSGIHRKAVWGCQLRVTDLRSDLLRLLRRAGCVQVEFGLESGSQRILDSMAKRATVEQNREAVQLAHRAGLRVLANVIVGYPGETREDLEQTRDMLTSTRPDTISVSRFTPLPGSPIYAELRQEGRVPQDWMAYTVANDLNYTAMPDEELDAAYMAMRQELADPANLKSFYLWDLRRRPGFYAWEMCKRLARSPLSTPRRVLSILQGRARAKG